ncbi:MAG: hypothetical protein ACRELT_07690 [Longimicrobiales bacterium]
MAPAAATRFSIAAKEIRREAVTDSLQALLDRVAQTRPFPRRQIAALYESGWQLPRYQAPVDQVVAGVDGTVWVREGAFLLGNAAWWVLDDRGNRVARVLIPTGLNVLRASADHVWGTQRGEFDEQYVVRMRVLKQ